MVSLCVLRAPLRDIKALYLSKISGEKFTKISSDFELID
jgi:hypothetical protein